MTNEELFNNNLGIAYKIAHQYKDCGVETEDLKQICLFGLWKAVITYCEDKGYTIGTYAYRVVQNEINYYLRNNRKYFTNKSFSEKVVDNITLEDTLADEHNLIEEIEKNIDNKIIINIIKDSNLKEKEKKILNLYLEGYKQKEIAKIVNHSQAHISRYLKKIRNILNKKFLK